MILAPAETTLRLFAFIPTWTADGLVWLEWVKLTVDRGAFAIFQRDVPNNG